MKNTKGHKIKIIKKKTLYGFKCECCGLFVKFFNQEKKEGTNYFTLCSGCYYSPSSCKIQKCKEIYKRWKNES